MSGIFVEMPWVQDLYQVTMYFKVFLIKFKFSAPGRSVPHPLPPLSRNQLRLRSEKWKILDLSCHKFWVNLHNLPSRQLRPGSDNNLLIRRAPDCRIICWHSPRDNISTAWWLVTWLRVRVVLASLGPSCSSKSYLPTESQSNFAWIKWMGRIAC